VTAGRAAVDGGLARCARGGVAAICDEIDRRGLPDGSLAIGHAGVALLHGHRARAGEDDAADRAFTSLGRALELVGERPVPWLFYGYAGIAFALSQLADVGGEGEIDEPLAQLHELIVQPLAAERWEYEWELVFGAIGLGVYGLERRDPAIVARVVEHLGACAERSGNGISWTSQDKDDPTRYYNLGIAHGMAGAVAFLAAASASPGAEELLRGAVTWLTSRARIDRVPIYPMTIGAPSATWHDLTLDGWCYGDSSTALALARAGAALGDAGLRTAGRDLALGVARRTDADLARIKIDSSLCHGSIGQAVILHRLACVYDDAELMAAARRWYERAITEPVPDGMDAGLQTGLAGLALGLVSGYACASPAWTSAFLLS